VAALYHDRFCFRASPTMRTLSVREKDKGMSLSLPIAIASRSIFGTVQFSCYESCTKEGQPATSSFVSRSAE
jgi:hypothetical protein